MSGNPTNMRCADADHGPPWLWDGQEHGGLHGRAAVPEEPGSAYAKTQARIRLQPAAYRCSIQATIPALAQGLLQLAVLSLRCVYPSSKVQTAAWPDWPTDRRLLGAAAGAITSFGLLDAG